MEPKELAPWLRRVDRLLGPMRGDHPASSALCAYAAGELGASERAELAAHLATCDECRELERAARAGLQELASRVAMPIIIAIPAPPAPRAFAATAEALEAPLPEDRTLLVDEPDLRLVYFRRGRRAVLGLFSEKLAALEELTCSLDGAALTPADREPEAVIFELGAARDLPGRTLELRLTLGAQPRTWIFTLVSD